MRSTVPLLSALCLLAATLTVHTAGAQPAPPGSADEAWIALCGSCEDCTRKLARGARTVVLTRDVDAAPGAPHCVALAHDGQTFDGGGHTLRGTGEDDQSGVVAAGLTGVTIRDCVLRNWGPSPGGYDESAIRLSYTFDSVVEDNEIHGGSDGIYLEYSLFNRIEDNEVHDSGWMGIDVLFESHANHVIGNRVEGAVHVGVAACIDTMDNVIEQNVIRNNPDQGICLCSNSHNNLLFNNYVCFNGMDIHVTGNSSGMGEPNVCDTYENWWELGKPGCTYECEFAPVE